MLKPKPNGSTNTQSWSLTSKDVESKMESDLKKLLQYCPANDRNNHWEEYMGFMKLFRKFLEKQEGALEWNGIEDVPRESLMLHDTCTQPESGRIRQLLSKLVIVKLNGGLGTSMRCNGPKCMIKVRDNLTFFDLTVQQIINLNAKYEISVPLVIMDSFNTADSTCDVIKKYSGLQIEIYSFFQNRYPRINSDNYLPLPKAYNDADQSCWYPPGHGNFYESFHASGLLKKFLEQGKYFCFVSNIDNLGATVDFGILNSLANSDTSASLDFMMEVTNKTSADLKGGTLIHWKGQLKLLEYAQVPSDHIQEFQGVKKFKMFNTNNLWMKLEAIRHLIIENKLSLDVIRNQKLVSSDGKTTEVIQLETAIGDAIGSFPSAIAVVVKRSRFLPVKTTSDLFLLRSNIYMCENGNVFMNPLRQFPSAPLVRLTDEHFGDYRDLKKRFAKMPDCLELHHLTICGDVRFSKDTSIKGNVTIIANHGDRIDIPQGSVLQDKIITGCFRILDH